MLNPHCLLCLVFIVFVWLWVTSFVSTCLWWDYIVNEFVLVLWCVTMCLFVFLVFVWLWVISFVSTCLWGYIVNEFVCGWEGASTIAPMSNCPIILNRAILINFDLASGFAIALDHQSLINSQNAGHDLELFCNAVEIAVKFIIGSMKRCHIMDVKSL